MLQFDDLAWKAQARLSSEAPFPPPYQTMAELETAADEWFGKWLAERGNIAAEKGVFSRLTNSLDKWIRTDLPEHTDNPDVSPERKLRIVRSLHRTNLLLGVYRNYSGVLLPLIKETAALKKRPVKVLELASGSGEMAMRLAAAASKKGLAVEVTGSDYVEKVVLDAQKRADERGNPTRFRVVNAFDMGTLAHGEYDIIYITGTMHHFSPGQLAVIMAQSQRAAGTYFVGLDGLRSMALLALLPIVHLPTFLPDHIHDAWFTARKFYSLFELECIARMAVRGASITATNSFPMVSVLKIRF